MGAIARRECCVTQITMYQSMYQEVVGRKIAVDARIICYAVGGHLRVLARGSTQRALLKGHGSGVCDMELANVSGGVAEDGESMAVLGGIAEDGSIFLWKVVRGDEIDEDDEEPVVSLSNVDAVKPQHPVEGRWYQRVAFRPGGGRGAERERDRGCVAVARRGERGSAGDRASENGR